MYTSAVYLYLRSIFTAGAVGVGPLFYRGSLIAYDINKQIPLLTILFLYSGRITLTIYRLILSVAGNE